MNHEMFFQLIGGLGFFLYGIRFMSDGLRKVASERLKAVLTLLTKRKMVAFFVGTGVTALIQSSSAMTVMVVGFVNAGLLTLKQSIPVVLGANIGTTVTAWLVSFFAIFNIMHYALPAVGIGFLLMILPRRPRLRRWGEVLFGFGTLFVGIGFMKDAFQPLQANPRIMDFMILFSRYPILGVCAGTLMTMLLQSSSATIALVQVLAFRGLIDFSAAIPIILGDNIGTTITAQIASLGGSTGARRVAWAHTMFNVIGVAYMLVFVSLRLYGRTIEWLVPGEITLNNIMLHIALAHTVFNSLNSAVFLPMTGALQAIVERIVTMRPDAISAEPQFLERHLLETPPLALTQGRKEIVRMLRMADSAFRDSLTVFMDDKWELAQKVHRKEYAVDNLQATITRYLIDISMENLEEEEAETIPVLIHSVNDIERIADNAENIVELAERKMSQKLVFTPEARAELDGMIDVVKEMVRDVLAGLEDGDLDRAREALEAEERLNEMQITLRGNHVNRLNTGVCDMLAGLVFLDFVDYLEKIGDHLTNIAQGLLGGLRWRPKHPPEEVLA